MSQLHTFGKQFIPTTVLFALLIWGLNWQKLAISQWIEQLTWLPYTALAVAAIFAVQFGRSRIVFCVLILVFLLLSPAFQVTLTSHILVSLWVLTAWLLWRPDKGLLPVNLGYSLLELTLVGLATYFLYPILTSLAQQPLTHLYPLMLNLGMGISETFTPIEFCLFVSLSVLCIGRLIISPTNSNVAIFLTFIALVLMFSDKNQYIMVTVSTLIAALYVVAIMVDSFNMAYRDELTGIPSRRALNQYVQTLGRKYVVVMSDIDHFKKFNDTYGHDVGDQVLRLVASKLSNVTGGGRAFRYGGEEFTLIFPRKAYNEVIAHVEVLREIIADYPIVLRGHDRPEHPPKTRQKSQQTSNNNKIVHVTCSFGVAQRTTECNDFESIVKQADIALYAAKKAGRNCVKKAE